MKNNTNEPKFEDMILSCIDCNNDFVLRKEESLWLYRKGLASKKRCPACLQRRRNQKESAQTANAQEGGERK